MLESELPKDHERIPEQMRQDLKAIREEMRTIEQVITSFDLYDVQIIDQRAMAGDNTWQGETGERAGRNVVPADVRNRPVTGMAEACLSHDGQ